MKHIKKINLENKKKGEDSRGVGDSAEGDLGRVAWVAGWGGEEEGGAEGVDPGEVTEEPSQGERGSRLNQCPLFSVSTRSSWSLGSRGCWGLAGLLPGLR